MSIKLSRDQTVGDNYIKFPNGFQMAWGYADLATGTSGKTVALPVTFVGIPRIMATPVNVEGNNINTVATVKNVTASSFWCYVYDLSLVYNAPRRFNWFAIGKWQ